MKNHFQIKLTLFFCLFFLFSNLYSQKGAIKSTTLSLSRNGSTNGFDYSGVNFKYQFINCGGEVQMMVTYDKNANFTKFWYNRKSYTKEDLGAELWPNSNQFNIGEVTADLFYGSYNLGKVSLNYIVGNFAGCFGETYGVISKVGKDPKLNEYKTNINSFSLKNVKVIGGGDPSTSRYYKIVERINKKNNDILRKKKEEELQAKISNILSTANVKLQSMDYQGAKAEFQKAYALKKDGSVLQSIQDIDRLVTEKVNKERLEKERVEQEKKQKEEAAEKSNYSKNNFRSTTINKSNTSSSITKTKTTNSTYNTNLNKEANNAINNAVNNYNSNIQSQLLERERLYYLRRQQDLEDERKFQIKQRRERDRIRQIEKENANYQKYLKEKKERERIAKIEEDKRYNSWLNFDKKYLDKQLEIWNNDVKVFVGNLTNNNGLSNLDNELLYIDKLSKTLDNVIISPNISIIEKHNIIGDIIKKTKAYNALYLKYNYNKIVPKTEQSKIDDVYLYAKAYYGYHPKSDNYLPSIKPKANNENKDIQFYLQKRKAEAKKAFDDNKVNTALFEYVSAVINANQRVGNVLNLSSGTSMGSYFDNVNLGYIFYYKGNFNSASSYLEAGLKHYEKNNKFSIDYFEAYSHLISVYTKKKFPREFIPDIELFEKRLKKAFGLRNLENVKLNKYPNDIVIDKNLQQSYLRVLISSYKELRIWRNAKTDFRNLHKEMLSKAKDVISKTENLNDLGDGLKELASILKYEDEKFYKKYFLNFKFNEPIEKYKDFKNSILLMENAYKQNDFILAEEIGKEILLKGNNLSRLGFNLSANYFDNFLYATKAALKNGHFENALTFLHHTLYLKRSYTPESTIRDTSDEKYAMLLISLLMLDKTKHNSLIFDQDYKELQSQNDFIYYMQKDLSEFAAKKINTVFGYQILEDIVNEFSKKKINSPAILYIYNAILSGKHNSKQ